MRHGKIQVSDLFSLKVGDDIIQDAENMLNGAYAPLSGFLRENDFRAVLNDMRLFSGKVWSMPIVLDIGEKDYQRLKNENIVVLADKNNNEAAALENIEVYQYDKREFARKVFGTEDARHPGVKEVTAMGEYLVGGDIKHNANAADKLNANFQEKPLNSRNSYSRHLRNFADSHYILTPEAAKKAFKEKGWNTIAAFQTRNVPHRSHEFLQKKALEGVDGLFIHPVVGKKKPGDFRDEVILESYKMLLEKYYPQDRSLLGVLPIKMRYAGPREAVTHALIRGNYGCTHMIIGRDHAGVGNYYGSYDAHNIFDEFSSDELGIEILKFENVSHCRSCDELKMEKTCAHEPIHKFSLSGTKIRDMIINKEKLPEELIRPEISEFLINHPCPFVE